MILLRTVLLTFLFGLFFTKVGGCTSSSTKPNISKKTTAELASIEKSIPTHTQKQQSPNDEEIDESPEKNDATVTEDNVPFSPDIKKTPLKIAAEKTLETIKVLERYTIGKESELSKNALNAIKDFSKVVIDNEKMGKTVKFMEKIAQSTVEEAEKITKRLSLIDGILEQLTADKLAIEIAVRAGESAQKVQELKEVEMKTKKRYDHSMEMLKNTVKFFNDGIKTLLHTAELAVEQI